MNLVDCSDCTTLPVLDAAWVVRDMGNDLEGYRDVAGFFVEDVQSMRDQLMANGAGSSLVLVPVIHEVANSMGVVGAWRGVCAVRSIERRLRSGEAIAPQWVADEVLKHLDETVQALRLWLEGAPVV